MELAQFFWTKQKPKKRKNWASYVTLSWRTNVKAQKRIHNMYWPGWWRHTELAQGHVSWLNFFRVFFVRFFRSKNWASYEALSQQRGIEPATRRWASNGALSQLRGTEPATKLLINSGTMWDNIEDWQSTHMYNYVYIYNPNRIIMANLRQHQFSWGRRVPLSWREIGKSNFRAQQHPAK